MNLVSMIGFGEAAYCISKGLKAEGLSGIKAYDIMYCQNKSPVMASRAKEADVELCQSAEEAYSSAEFIFSLTNARVAVDIASSIIPHLRDGQVYVDMNSASPMTKEAIAAIPHDDGVLICDAAIMSTVPQKGHKTPMFLAGDGAKRFCDAMTQYHMNLTVLDAAAGGASAIKMIKSIVMKGLPQLMFESFEAADRYGVLDILVESLNQSLAGKSIEDLANTFIARTMIHASRRAGEMSDVIDTLKTLGIDYSMTEATLKKLKVLETEHWSDIIGIDGGNMPYKDAIRLINKEHERNDK